MSRIRRVNSYKSPYLPMHKLSDMKAYGHQSTDSVNKVESVPPVSDEQPQFNKYVKLSSSKEAKQELNTLNRRFETVTLHLEKYEELRRSQEKLQQLEHELKQMIQFISIQVEDEASNIYGISVSKQIVQKLVQQKMRQGELSPPGRIDTSHIRLSK